MKQDYIFVFYLLLGDESSSYNSLNFQNRLPIGAFVIYDCVGIYLVKPLSSHGCLRLQL